MTCAKRNCPTCASVKHSGPADTDAALSQRLNDAAQPDPHWSDDTPHRYAWPTTD